MQIRLTIPKFSFSFRDFRNDFKHNVEKDLARVLQTALPFLALYDPAARPLAIFQGTIRVLHTNNLPDRAVSVAALAGFILFPVAGYAITTLQDTAGNITRIYKLTKDKKVKEIALEVVYLANNVFYLATIFYAKVELRLASLTIQILVSGISAKTELGKGNWLEGGAALAMGALQFKAAIPLGRRVYRNWETARKVARVYVGKLAELWQYPSDHLPVGAEVNGIKVVSWNVLNTNYMEWVNVHDTQGLNGSMITDLHKPDAEGVTLRDRKIVEMVTQMTETKDLIALQECSPVFLSRLLEALPAQWRMVKTTQNFTRDQDVVIYRSDALTYRPEQSTIAFDAYPSSPGKPVQNLFFETPKGDPLRVINTHVPGDPALGCWKEFAKYVFNASKDGEPMVVLGDNNFEMHQMDAAYQEAGFIDYDLYFNYRTNIGNEFESKGIDPIFVKDANSHALSSREVDTTGGWLQRHIDLLSMPRARS